MYEIPDGGETMMLSGKVALITGSARGIGRAIAERFSAEGATVVINDVGSDAGAVETLEALKAAGGKGSVEMFDVSDAAQVEASVKRILVDILVNNAGFGLAAPFLRGPLADEERMLDVLVRAVLVLTRAAAPGMVSRRRGSIITVSSVAGFLPGGTYSAAKAWATAFTTSLAGQLAGTGVTATALCPGFVRTGFQERAKIDVSYLPGWAWLDADRLVDSCLADVRRGRSLSVPSLRYKSFVFLLRHIPLRLAGGLAAWRARLSETRGRS